MVLKLNYDKIYNQKNQTVKLNRNILNKKYLLCSDVHILSMTSSWKTFPYAQSLFLNKEHYFNVLLKFYYSA